MDWKETNLNEPLHPTRVGKIRVRKAPRYPMTYDSKNKRMTYCKRQIALYLKWWNESGEKLMQQCAKLWEQRYVSAR